MNQADQVPERKDEISLVDLAIIFVRRRRILYFVLLACLVAGICFALLKEDLSRKSYVTVLRLADVPELGKQSDSSGESTLALNGKTERVATVLAILDTRWVPEAISRHSSLSEGSSASVKTEAIDGTELIRFTSTGSELTAEKAQQLHRLLAELVIQQQNQFLTNRVVLLENQLHALDSVIENHGADNLVAAKAIEQRLLLQQMIAMGEPAAILSLAKESAGVNVGASKALVIALSIVMGLVLGVLAVVMAEFLARVRSAMLEADATTD